MTIMTIAGKPQKTGHTNKKMRADNSVISLGPYFIAQAPQPPDPKLTDANLLRLNLRMEFSTPKGVQFIDLFQYISPDSPHRTFEEVVFHESQLRFSMTLREYMIVKTPLGEFISLDRLLAELYDRRLVARPLLPVLRELGEKAKLISPTSLDYRTGLLIPAAEDEGFRLLGTYQAENLKSAFAHLVWMPSPTAEHIHVAMPEIRYFDPGRPMDGGKWKRDLSPSLSRLLQTELRRLAPGDKPLSLLTPAGLDALLYQTKVFVGFDTPMVEASPIGCGNDPPHPPG